MKHGCLVMGLVLGASPFCAAEISFKPAGIQVVWDAAKETFEGFSTMNTEPGVVVSLLFDSDGASFIGVDEDASKLTIGGVEADCHYFGQQSELSKDGKHLRLRFTAKGAKAEGGSIPVAGEVVVLTASETGEASSEVVELKKGVVLSFPEEAKMPKFTIDGTGKPDWGDEEFEFTLKCKGDYREPAGVKLVDEDGKEHKLESGGSSRMAFGKMVTREVSYKTAKKVGKAKLVIEYWKDLEEVKVPVEVKLGLGGVE